MSICHNISYISAQCYIWFIAQLCAYSATLLCPWNSAGPLLQKAFCWTAENLKINLKMPHVLHDILSSAFSRCILPSHGVQNDQTSPYLNWKHWSSCITKHLLDKVEHFRASTHLYSPGVGALFEPENICWMAATMWDCCLTGLFKEQDHPSLKMLDTFVLSYRSVWVQSSIYLFISKEHLHHHSYL